MRRLFAITAERTVANEAAITGLRVVLGLSMALGHGLGKVPVKPGLVKAVGGLGFPAPELFAWAAALSELGGGLLLALGLATRLGALAMAFTMGVAAFVLHAGDPFGEREKAILFLAGAVFFAVRGAGRWSIDRYLSRS